MNAGALNVDRNVSFCASICSKEGLLIVSKTLAQRGGLMSDTNDGDYRVATTFIKPGHENYTALLRHVISITNIVKPMRTDDSFVIVSLALSSLLPETRSKAD